MHDPGELSRLRSENEAYRLEHLRMELAIHNLVKELEDAGKAFTRMDSMLADAMENS